MQGLKLINPRSPHIQKFHPIIESSVPRTVRKLPVFWSATLYPRNFACNMRLDKRYETMKHAFKPEHELTAYIDGSDMNIRNLHYNSTFRFPTEIENHLAEKHNRYSPAPDPWITENNRFNIPILFPDKRPVHDSAIIILHGLNERNWNKYLPWAHYLVEKTDRPVILFPISFHVNRGPVSWTDPKTLRVWMEDRNHDHGMIRSSTYINLTLSERLYDLPERFFLSGYRSAVELFSLMSDIKQGKMPWFGKECRIDIFAYSIGILLAQCMMIANPEHAMDASSFVFFCGGSLFSQMNGESKYIMDQQANKRIHHYYEKEIESGENFKSRISQLLYETLLGKAFRSMIKVDELKTLREKMLGHFQPRTLTFALKKDRVIPAEASRETLSFGNRSNKNLIVYDPGYPYLHENPFPIKLTREMDRINAFFEEIFSASARFLSL